MTVAETKAQTQGLEKTGETGVTALTAASSRVGVPSRDIQEAPPWVRN
jgi:hypothetical protein